MELLEEGEYILANNLEGATGGPWTWFCRGDGQSKSCLDLVIFSADLLPYFDSMKIDKAHEFSASKVQTKKGKKRLIFSDHCPLVVNFEKLPTQRIKAVRKSTWKLNAPGGWKKYEVLTNKIQAKMDKYIKDKSFNIEVVKRKIDSLQTKVKFQAFGKSKPSTEKAKNRRLEREQKAASQLDDEGSRMEEIQQQQSALIETAINKIKADKHGKKTNVHKMKEVVLGPKKQQQEAHAGKDSKTGKTVVSTKEIKRVNLEHCLEVLKNNVPKPEVVNLLKFQ